jgi:hypothetical protein
MTFMLIISFQGKYQSRVSQKDVPRHKKLVFILNSFMRNILSGCDDSFRLLSSKGDTFLSCLGLQLEIKWEK